MIHASLKTTAALFASFAAGHHSVSARDQSFEEALRAEISRRSATAFEKKWNRAVASDVDFETKLNAMEKELQAMEDFTDSESDGNGEIEAPATNVNSGFLNRLSSSRKSGGGNAENSMNPTAPSSAAPSSSVVTRGGNKSSAAPSSSVVTRGGGYLKGGYSSAAPSSSVVTRGSFLGGLLRRTVSKVVESIQQKVLTVKFNFMDLKEEAIAPRELPASTRVRALYRIVKNRGLDAFLFVQGDTNGSALEQKWGKKQLDLYSKRTLGSLLEEERTDPAGPNELNVFVLQRNRFAELRAAVRKANTPTRVIHAELHDWPVRDKCGINSYYFKLRDERHLTPMKIEFDERKLYVTGTIRRVQQIHRSISWESDWDSTRVEFGRTPEGNRTIEFCRVGTVDCLALQQRGGGQHVGARTVLFQTWCALFSDLAQSSRDLVDAGAHSCDA